jgi:hypothetical protein
MAVADLKRSPITIHHVVLEFLRGERTKIKLPQGTPLLDGPNLSDPIENHQRLRLLYHPQKLARFIFMLEIPADTCWWEVHGLTQNELDELHVSARHTKDWDVGRYKLKNVAAAVQIPLTSPPSSWPGRVILWGHDWKGPFTIMEGNHRLLAYAAAHTRPPINLDVYVGISPSFCFWHCDDPVSSLVQ